MSDLVERVAAAMCDDESQPGEYARHKAQGRWSNVEQWRKRARAAVSVIEQSSNVVQLPRKQKITTDDIPPDNVLEKAISADLRHVLVLGYTAEWDEYFAGSSSDVTANAWLCQRFTFKQLIAGDD